MNFLCQLSITFNKTFSCAKKTHASLRINNSKNTIPILGSHLYKNRYKHNLPNQEKKSKELDAEIRIHSKISESAITPNWKTGNCKRRNENLQNVIELCVIQILHQQVLVGWDQYEDLLLITEILIHVKSSTRFVKKKKKNSKSRSKRNVDKYKEQTWNQECACN